MVSLLLAFQPITCTHSLSPPFVLHALPTDWTKKRVDKFVGETANAIDAKFPGKVVDVNVNVLKPSGKELAGEFDILLDDAVIQVKSGIIKQAIINNVRGKDIISIHPRYFPKRV